MNPLVIELKSGGRRNFTFLGWHQDGNAFYVRDENGDPKLVELRVPYPHNLDTGLPFELAKIEPVAIFPHRLAPPDCVATEEVADELTGGLFSKQNWLYPQPKHDQALRRALKEFQKSAAKNCAAKIADLKPMRSPKAERQREIARIKAEFHPKLSLTLGQLKHGETAFSRKLRDDVLIKAWADEFHVDLELMNQMAKEFEPQWWKAAGKGRRLPREALQLSLSSVRFALRFVMGTTFYLTGINIRSLLTTAEVEEFQQLEGMGQPKTELTEEWHSPDFRSVWRQNEIGAPEQLDLPNEFRALCLMLHERAGKSAQYTEIQPKIGGHTRELDLEDGQGSMASASGSRRVRDMLNTQTGRLLLRWGILVVREGVGRKKFLKLCPPR